MMELVYRFTDFLASIPAGYVLLWFIYIWVLVIAARLYKANLYLERNNMLLETLIIYTERLSHVEYFKNLDKNK